MTHHISDAEFYETLMDGVQRAQAGDDESLQTLFIALAPIFHRIAHEFLDARPRLREEGDSDDFTHILLIHFAEDLRSGNMSAFTREQFLLSIETMARHKLSDAARAQRAQKRDVRRKISLVEALGVADREPSPPEHVIACEVIAAVREELSEREWIVVEMRYAGWTWEEIAAEFGCSISSVRRTWRRVQERLRNLFNAPPRERYIHKELNGRVV